jgi:hypothetical protein
MNARSWGAGPKMSDRGGGCEATSAIPCFATRTSTQRREHKGGFIEIRREESFRRKHNTCFARALLCILKLGVTAPLHRMCLGAELRDIFLEYSQ